MRQVRVIDHQGRLFGRINLIDAAAIASIALLLPLGYTAVWLFRTPAPQILSIDPATLRPGKDLRVRVMGKDLRPFLRASVGGKEASFLVESSTTGEVKLPDLAPGSYELVLYDVAQEVARRAAAIVIEPPPAPPTLPPLPSMTVDVLGAFVGLNPGQVRSLSEAQKLGDKNQPGSGEILSVQPPEPDVLRLRGMPFLTPRDDRFRLLALLRLRCEFVDGDCKFGGTRVAPGAMVAIPWRDTTVQFEVAGLFPTATEALPEVNAMGAFVGLDAAGADHLAQTAPATLSVPESWGRVLSLGPSEPETVRLRGRSEFLGVGTTGKYSVSALLAVRCAVLGNDCRLGSISVTPGARLPVPTRQGLLVFDVTDVSYADVGPRIEVKLGGAFLGLDAARVTALSKMQAPNQSLSDFWGSVLSLGPPESSTPGAADNFRVSALLSLRCVLVGNDCRLGSTAVAAGARLAIPTKLGILPFQVADLYPADMGALTDVKLAGTFVGVDAVQAATVSKMGSEQSLPDFWGHVLSVGRPESFGEAASNKYKVSAMLAARCALVGNECKIGSTSIAPRARLSIPTRQGILTFEVVDVYPVELGPLADVKVNGAFVGVDMSRTEELSKMGPSDQWLPEVWRGILSVGTPELETVRLGAGSGLGGNDSPRRSEPVRGGTTGKYSVRAVLDVRCVVTGSDCRVGTTAVTPEARLPVPTRHGILTFEVADFYPSEAGPLAEMELGGAFVGLDGARAASLANMKASGQSLAESWGRILSLGPPEGETMQLREWSGATLPAFGTSRFRVSAVISVRCAVVGKECRIGNTSVAPDSRLTLPTKQGILMFEIADLYPAGHQFSAEVKVSGTFVGLDAARAETLSSITGADQSAAESWGRILSTFPVEPEIVRLKAKAGAAVAAGTTGMFAVGAVIRVRCTMVGSICRIGSTVVAPDARIVLPTSHGSLTFEVTDFYAIDLTFLDVTIRCASDRTILSLAEQELSRNSKPPDGVEPRPRILALRDIKDDVTLRTGFGFFSWDQPGVAFSAVIRVPAQKDGIGWQYQGAPLRAGERFIYSQPNYTLTGAIIGIHVLGNEGPARKQ